MKYKIEFDENDENFDVDDINVITNRETIKCAFYDIQALLHILVNRKIYDQSLYKYDNETQKDYVEIDYVENKVREIYDRFKFLKYYE